MRAGELIHGVAFDSPVEAADGYGGTTLGWQEQFSCRAGFVHLRGGETVMAARLAGKHQQIVTVRSSAASRAVTTDWRVRDTRTGDIFNIRDVTPPDDRLSLDFLCEKGVAT